MQRKTPKSKTTLLPPGVGTNAEHATENAPEAGESRSDFIDRALTARDAARITGEYFTADEVLRELDELHARAPAASGK